MSITITTTTPLPDAEAGVAYSLLFTESSGGMAAGRVFRVNFAAAALGTVTFLGDTISFTPIDGTGVGSPALITVELYDTGEGAYTPDIVDFYVAVLGGVTSGCGSGGVTAAMLASLRRRQRRGVADRDGVRVPELWWPTVTVRPGATVKESLTVQPVELESATEDDWVEGDD